MAWRVDKAALQRQKRMMNQEQSQLPGPGREKGIHCRARIFDIASGGRKCYQSSEKRKNPTGFLKAITALFSSFAVVFLDEKTESTGDYTGNEGDEVGDLLN
ncbi:hypothetical protein MUK42_21908 [Musa troglodytarum]|uniref:Uncharacterized protein n=1 Tax=Musa troglodytarum TaxID=320322 RepID=A0A9E7G740_9LILI|nr:hypothetical protein MUK42_21908 [Musa troglodytarum]